MFLKAVVCLILGMANYLPQDMAQMIFRNRLVMDSYYRETVALKTANEKMEDELVERDNRIRELESTAAKMERLIDDLLAENAQLKMRVYQGRAS